MSEIRSIIMRCNRLLGAALVEANLISVEDLEAANEKMLLILEEASEREICLMHILLNETQSLNEQHLLDYMAEERSIGLIDVREVDMQDELKASLDLALCWATWTVPFDRDDDVHYLASAYVLSPAVKEQWEQRLSGPVIWYGTTIAIVGEFLEKLEAERVAGNTVAGAA